MGVLSRLSASRLATNTAWMIGAYFLRTVLQGAYFVIIARLLGPREYGAFIGVVAVVTIVSPFATLGFGNIMVRKVARNVATVQVSWGNALVVSLVLGSALIFAVCGVSRIVLPETLPLVLIVCVAAADLIFTPMVDLSAQAFQSVEKLSGMASLLVLSSASRLLASVVIVGVYSSPSAVDWAMAYLGAAAVTAFLGVGFVTHQFGAPRFRVTEIFSDLSEGFYFSVSLASVSIYNDVDKALLPRLSTLQAAGNYGAAYRIIDVAYSPVRSMLSSTYGRFFQHGATGLAASVRFSLKLLPFGAGYGLFVGIGLLAAADLLPRVLGPLYSDSAIALRWLSPVPLLRACSALAADALTGAGHQKLRSRFQVGVAAGNIGLCLWLIPMYSWKGAAWATLICDGILPLVLWGTIHRLLSMPPDQDTDLDIAP